MRGLTLTQPWATLMALGAKRIETRSWQHSYRGLVAIHAAKTVPRWAEDIDCTEPFLTYLYDRQIPRGVIVAVGRLVDYIPTNTLIPELRATLPAPDTDEYAFGDYSPYRYAWLFEDVRPLAQPIPCRGMYGLWEMPSQLVDAVMEQVEV